MSTTVKVNMKPIQQILKEKGLSRDGDVQRFVTNTINRRIGKYMPHRSGALETKQKHVVSATEIEVLGPNATYQYYGKAMEGKPPMTVTDRDLQYTKTFNPQAGPFWDKRLMASEGPQIRQETQDYINRKKGRP